MALPTITDTYRVAINYVADGSSMTATNVIHVRAEASSEDDVFAAIDDAVTATMWAPCSDKLAVDTVVVTKLDGTPDGKVYTGTDLAGAWPNGGGTQQFTPQACALVRFRTNATGRSGRGRVYLPFVAEGNATDGEIDGTVTTNCTSAWNAFAVAMTTDSGVDLVVASYLHASAAAVVSSLCETPLATQRKRMRR